MSAVDSEGNSGPFTVTAPQHGASQDTNICP